MNTIEKLKQLKAFLNVPGQWTQGYGAKDVNDVPVNFIDSRAVKWCALGGIDYFFRNTTSTLHIKVVLQKSADKLYNMHLVSVNDFLGLDAVNKVIDDAIANYIGE